MSVDESCPAEILRIKDVMKEIRDLGPIADVGATGKDHRSLGFKQVDICDFRCAVNLWRGTRDGILGMMIAAARIFYAAIP